MSGTASYQYLSDNGLLYQVVLPTDFAVPLGLVPATGAEALLPDYVSPRYATYQSLAPILWRQAVLGTKAAAVSPPAVVTVDGITYYLKSVYGETVLSVTSGNVMLASGPQGPKGDTGANGTNAFVPVLVTASNLGLITVNNTLTTLASMTLPAGSYFLDGSAILKGSTTTLTTLILEIDYSGGATYWNAGGMFDTADTRTRTLCARAAFAISGSTLIKLNAQSSTAVTFACQAGNATLSGYRYQ